MSYPDLRIFTGSRGFPCASIGGINFHSQVDPIRESARIAESPENAGADVVILVGLGLGYVLDGLLKQNPGRTVLLVEPDPGWLPQAVAVRDEAALPLVGMQSIPLVSPDSPDALIAALQDAGSRNPTMIVNPAIRKLFPVQVRACEETLQKYRDRFQINVNTLKRFGRLWVRNLARNLPALAMAGAVSVFQNVFSGLPGLLIAGGPSLDSILPSLKELRERFVLVAVDTSLRACLAAGVDPDFVLMIDPQYWNTRHLDSCTTSRALVISESSILPRSLRQTRGTVFFCSSLFPLGQYFENLLGERGKLGAGGSVATTAWDFLRYAGVRDIWLAGLDLSFPGGQTHFHGSVFEEATHRDASRLVPAAQRRYEYLFGAGTYACPSTDGGTVLSDRRMDIYVQWFETQARMYPEVHNRRIGKGSRSMEGFSETTLAECLELTPRREEIDIRIKIALDAEKDRKRAPQTKPENQRALVEKGRTALCSELHSLRKLSQNGLTLVENAKSALSSNSHSGELALRLKELDMLDQLLLNVGQLRIVGFLVEDLIQEISVAAKPENLADALGVSTRLYGAMYEAACYHLELFEKTTGDTAQDRTTTYR